MADAMAKRQAERLDQIDEPPDGDEELEDLEEDVDLLLALEESLCCKRVSLENEACQVEMVKPGHQIPDSMEVRLCVASFLLWSELVASSILCKAWRVLELEDTLWQVYFSTTWPRLARRREAVSGGFSQPWRVLFRAQWTRGNHKEDAVEEDWLDFNAAQRLRMIRMPSMDSLSPTCDSDLKKALQRCREDLFQKGVLSCGSKPGAHMYRSLSGPSTEAR